MKRVILFATAAMAISTVASAQRAKVTLAENALLINKYDDAKTNIDLALEHEKTKDDVRTYLVAAEVYSQLYANSKDAQGLETAKAHMTKAIELDAKGDAKGKNIGKYEKKIAETLTKLSGIIENAGGMSWNNKDYKSSEEAFLGCIWFNSKQKDYVEASDTLLFINSGIAAMQAEDWVGGAQSFLKAAENRGGGHMSFLRAQYCYAQLKDSANIEITLKKGFEMYPQESDMINSLINYYLSAQKNDEALVYLNSAIEKDPNNAQYYFARGCLKEKIDMSQAIEDYKTAVSKDGAFYNALYNLGVAYYNIGLSKKSEASNYYKKEDLPKNKALMQEGDEAFKSAAPYMRKAADSAEDNDRKLEALKTLRTIYYQIDTDKYAQVDSEIKALQQ